MKRSIFYALMALVLIFSSISTVFAQDGGPDRLTGRELPARADELRLDSPVEMDGISADVLDRSLVGAVGASKVIIRLSVDSGAAALWKR